VSRSAIRRAIVGSALLLAGALALQPASVIAAPRAFALPARSTSALAPPQLSAGAAALMEESTGAQLYGLNPYRELAIASTTKLMTALLTLEHVHRLGIEFAQNNYFPAPIDSQIGLRPGELMSVHDLLIAMLLPSADDAAEDLAYNVGRHSIGYFIGMMDVRARELHLDHTHYSTPIGLDTPGNYSSASNLVMLARYVLQTQPFFRRVVALPAATLHTGPVGYVVNRNLLVGRVPWINGVKTGQTRGAGYVLVGSGTQGGMTLISAVLGTSSESARDSNTLALLNWGFANFHLVTPVRRGTVLARPALRNQAGHAIVVAARTYESVFARTTHIRLRVRVPTKLVGPIAAGARVGTVSVLAGGRTVATVPLVLRKGLPAVSTRTIATGLLLRPGRLLGAALLICAALGAGLHRRHRSIARAAPGG
jgi:D-alanyl-D-alanine carboxypeptidase (penicillin-binding protein 5/6)